jgi:hypothetical protein
VLLVIDCDEVERGRSSSADKGAAGPPGHLSGRVGKNPVFFLNNPSQCFFLLLYFCPEERVFRVFSVSRILLVAYRL